MAQIGTSRAFVPANSPGMERPHLRRGGKHQYRQRRINARSQAHAKERSHREECAGHGCAICRKSQANIVFHISNSRKVPSLMRGCQYVFFFEHIDGLRWDLADAAIEASAPGKAQYLPPKTLQVVAFKSALFARSWLLRNSPWPADTWPRRARTDPPPTAPRTVAARHATRPSVPPTRSRS
jgi:hypothetical protein